MAGSPPARPALPAASPATAAALHTPVPKLLRIASMTCLFRAVCLPAFLFPLTWPGCLFTFRLRHPFPPRESFPLATPQPPLHHPWHPCIRHPDTCRVTGTELPPGLPRVPELEAGATPCSPLRPQSAARPLAHLRSSIEMCCELKSKNFSLISGNFIHLSHTHNQVLNCVERTRPGFL